MDHLVPVPVEVRAVPGDDFAVTAGVGVRAGGAAAAVGELLAEVLRDATGFAVPVDEARGAIALTIDDGIGHPEEYRLAVTRDGVALTAGTARGLFAGVQTLRQLLGEPWAFAGGVVRDRPRFAHRGVMLDVARHFFTVAEVRRFIDGISRYKINVLHLHLTDDQGWRIEIERWPRLAAVGGATQVGGGPGGFYTQREYRELVDYAAARNVTVIPEIDLPGHVNAALVAYPELGPAGVAPAPFTRHGNAKGFSSLAIDQEVTYRFVDDVLREVAALTPGPYLHLGTDETHATPEDGFLAFLARVLPMASQHGKAVIGWHEILRATPPASVIPQYWGRDSSDERMAAAVARGSRVVLSPAHKVYLDMKYDPGTPIGFDWAAFIEVADVYDWDPGTYLAGVPEAAVHGIEGPLWSETLRSYRDAEYLAFPRVAALAELAWSPRAKHDWPDFARRLAAHGPRWTAEGVNFHRSPQIAWVD
ncbi:beta-N-acetylhexosaminidase [Dactylosporangium sp. NPDC005572]|uniref:beta-N-acetylhexosaminidase n=1 Tax=Dactylosporangium sp. NPDC005572 TaxID=3156889 RepID=UPI0033BCB294